jgi:hypothetical protein
MKTANYWTKSHHVTAVRLDTSNIKDVAIAIGGDYWEDEKSSIKYHNDRVFIGDWVVFNRDNCSFFTHERFMREFQTFAEEASENEKLAKIHSLILSAMSKQDVATYQGESSCGMDIVAAQAAKDILAII